MKSQTSGFWWGAANTSTVLKSLGMNLDAALNMESHVTSVAKVTFFHLLQVRQLAPFLSYPHLATVTHTTVTTSLDYCNLLYTDLPLWLTWKLQYSGMSPDGNITNGTYATFTVPDTLVTNGVPNQVQGFGVDFWGPEQFGTCVPSNLPSPVYLQKSIILCW